MPQTADHPPAGAGCIFVTGVWKSGNHLVYSALNQMGVDGPFNGIAAHLLFGRHAWAKRILRRPRGRGDALQVGLEVEARISRRWVSVQARRLSGRILGGHAAHDPGLERVLRDTGARMICIRRDPRDILVSFADWIGGRADFYMHSDFAPLPREDRVRLLLRGGPTSAGPLLPFHDILARGAGWLNVPGMLQVTFEDLLGPAGGGDARAQRATLAAIHAHVGAPVPLAQLDAAAIYGGSLTFNKGRSQRWRELDDSTLVQEIETTLGPHLDRWGYVS